MSKWEMVRLGDVCNILSGYAFESSCFTEDVTAYPLIRIRDVVRGYTKTYYSGPYDEKYVVKNGDVLIGMDGEFNISEWKGTDALLNQRVCKITTESILLNERYMLFFLSKALKKIEDSTSFVTVKHLSTKTINQITIPLPPLEVQQKIAQILDAAAEVLTLRKQQLAELDNLLKSVFYELFGDPVTNEKGWDIERLGDKLSIVSGFAFKSSGFQKSGVPVIKIGNINLGTFTDKEMCFWKYDKKLERVLLHPRDIVISLTGTVGKNDYANVCILPEKYPRYYLNQRNAKLDLSAELECLYLLYLLKDQKIKNQLTGLSRGIRQANISNSDISNLLVPLPPLDLQNQFAEIVTKIEEQKALVQTAIDESQYLFDSLMNEYFN